MTWLMWAVPPTLQGLNFLKSILRLLAVLPRETALKLEGAFMMCFIQEDMPIRLERGLPLSF